MSTKVLWVCFCLTGKIEQHLTHREWGTLEKCQRMGLPKITDSSDLSRPRSSLNIKAGHFADHSRPLGKTFRPQYRLNSGYKLIASTPGPFVEVHMNSEMLSPSACFIWVDDKKATPGQVSTNLLQKSEPVFVKRAQRGSVGRRMNGCKEAASTGNSSRSI